MVNDILDFDGRVDIRYCEKKYSENIDKNKVNVIFELGSRDALDAIRIDITYEPEEMYFRTQS